MTTLVVSLTTLAVLSVLAASVYAFAATATHGVLQPATVNPFHPGLGGDPAADTLADNTSLSRTAFAPRTDWQIATLSSLTAVEDLLDSLEAHGVREREVVTLSAECFAVRWK